MDLSFLYLCLYCSSQHEFSAVWCEPMPVTSRMSLHTGSKDPGLLSPIYMSLPFDLICSFYKGRWSAEVLQLGSAFALW